VTIAPSIWSVSSVRDKGLTSNRGLETNLAKFASGGGGSARCPQESDRGPPEVVAQSDRLRRVDALLACATAVNEGSQQVLGRGSQRLSNRIDLESQLL
jgi:hypothetical protein